MVIHWVKISVSDPGKAYSLFPLVNGSFRKDLGFLLWIMEGIREVDEKFYSFDNSLLECTNPQLFPTLVLAHTIEVTQQLLETNAKDPFKECVEAIAGLLPKTIQKFTSFGRLWSHILSSGTKVSPDLHHSIFFQSILHLFASEKGTDLEKLNWKTLGQVMGQTKGMFLQIHGSGGFQVLVPAIRVIWDQLLQPALAAKQRSRFLYSILEFFLFTDMEFASKRLDEYHTHTFAHRHMGCHHPNTLSRDLAILLELFDEQSRHKDIWINLSSFVVPHKLLELLQSTYSADFLETCLADYLSQEDLKKRVASFEPPQFAECPKITRSLIYSVFLAYLQRHADRSIEDLGALLSLSISQGQLAGLDRLGFLALEVCILQKTADLVSGAESLEKVVADWRTNKAKNIVSRLLDKHKDRQVYFLHSIKNLDRMNEFVRSHDALTLFSFNDTFLIREGLKGTKFYLYPFVVDQTSQLGAKYLALEGLVNGNQPEPLADWITTCCNGGPHAYLQARLFLANVAYYSHYNQAKPCPVIENVLARPQIQQLLKLSEDDCRAYKIFTSGGVKSVKDDDLLWFFSNEKRDDLYDMTTRHLMANVLIFTLGCPPGSNHFYTRIFTPEKLSSGVRGPGSTFPNEQDCGYYLSDTGELEVRDGKYNNIFGGSRLYRLAFNMVTWDAICLAMLVNPAKNQAPIGNICYHGSYRNYDPVLAQKKHLSDEQALKNYVLQRPNMYYVWLSLEKNLTDNNMVAPFFVTQVLFKVWCDLMATLGTPQGAVYRGTYPSDQETLQYENRIKQVGFDAVMHEFNALRQPYENFLKENKEITLVMERRDQLAQFQMQSLRIISRETFVQSSSSLPADQFLNITKFKEHKRYRSIKYVPFLVNAYHWIHERLSLRVPEASLITISFWNAIQLLGEDEKRVGESLFEQLEEAWNDLVANHPNYQVCRIAAAAGESDIPKFSRQFPLSALISPGYDANDFDHLFRLIKDLSDLQGTLAKEKNDYEVASLPKNYDAFSVILNLDNAEDPLFWVRHYATLTESGTTFDWDAIDAKVGHFALPGIFLLFLNLIPPPPLYTFAARGQVPQGPGHPPNHHPEEALPPQGTPRRGGHFFPQRAGP